MFDTHCHLQYFDNPAQVISAAQEAGLKGLLSLATDESNFPQTLDFQKHYPTFVRIGLGIHPEHITSLNSFDQEFLTLENLISLHRSNITAIGECGLDYFHTTENMDIQKICFARQVELAGKYSLPLVIHSRNRKEESMNIPTCIEDAVNIVREIKQEKYPALKGVFHCFTGSLDEAEKIIQIGFHIGFTNIVTYKKNVELQYIAKYLIEKYPGMILFETDAPYLPPAHRRGERCYPSDVSYVYEYFKPFDPDISNIF